jgi:hypothetical protein
MARAMGNAKRRFCLFDGDLRRDTTRPKYRQFTLVNGDRVSKVRGVDISNADL